MADARYTEYPESESESESVGSSASASFDANCAKYTETANAFTLALMCRGLRTAARPIHNRKGGMHSLPATDDSAQT